MTHLSSDSTSFAEASHSIDLVTFKFISGDDHPFDILVKTPVTPDPPVSNNPHDENRLENVNILSNQQRTTPNILSPRETPSDLEGVLNCIARLEADERETPGQICSPTRAVSQRFRKLAKATNSTPDLLTGTLAWNETIFAPPFATRLPSVPTCPDDAFDLAEAEILTLAATCKADWSEWDDRMAATDIIRMTPSTSSVGDFMDARGHITPIPSLEAKLLALKNAQNLADKKAEIGIPRHSSWFLRSSKTGHSRKQVRCSRRMRPAFESLEARTVSIIQSLPHSYSVESFDFSQHGAVPGADDEQDPSFNCSIVSTPTSDNTPVYDGLFDSPSPAWSLHRVTKYGPLGTIAKYARDGRDFVTSKASSLGSMLTDADDVFPGGLVPETR
ncbi:hypothetical protein BV22DRAFT_1051985 [Leucogyrophana mollusca]|uniref:Uncharacterized protein n=1 Tax=Leucogyrophana mollusca TaxID=85980 RepID=A0ACB8AXE1_9AGAM|nr:hypothetical protein BV22DRAFT_1051985 [Leucogyrophana mollusca]